MSVKMRLELEKKIVGQFVKDALSAGHRLSVSLERGYDVYEMLIASTDYNKIIDEAFAGNECHIFVHDADGPTVKNNLLVADGWVYCIYGNDGYDVISDYTVNLEKLLTEANKIADYYAD